MKILLVDDHDLVLKGMSAIFRENFPEMTVTTASSGQKAIEEIRKADTDLTVLDLELPDISGFSLIRMIRQEAPAIKIIVNTVHEEIWTIRQLRQCNVDGVVFKSIDSSALVRTVREVIGGARPGFNADTKESVLSPKELEILQLLAKGMKGYCRSDVHHRKHSGIPPQPHHAETRGCQRRRYGNESRHPRPHPPGRTAVASAASRSCNCIKNHGFP